MSDPVTLKNAQDAYVNSAHPSTNYNNAAKMYLQDGAFGFMFFGQPFPEGATIINSYLETYNGDDWGGTVNYKVALVDGKWTASKVKWNNKPGVTGPNTVVSKTGADAGTLWHHDLTAQMQIIADGGADWYGLRLDIDGATRHWIHSTQSRKVAMRPVLVIQWSEGPETPSDLISDDWQVVSTLKPTFRFDFNDVFGDTDMGGYQLQISNTESFADIAFDSGDQDSVIPECDLNDFAFALTANADFYWRVRVRDETNVWSEYSHVASGTHSAYEVLTLNGPSTDTPIIEESTPPFLWSQTGTQTKYRFQIVDPETMDILFDTGEVTSADEELTPPSGVFTVPGKVYRWNMSTWDDKTRASTPGFPPFVTQSLDFTFTPSATPAKVLTLAIDKTADYPGAVLTFTCTTPPDSFTVIRDGKVYQDNIDPVDVFVAGTTYEFIDTKVKNRTEHTWEVARVVNHQMSTDNPTVTERFAIVGPWLMEPDGSNAIMLLEADVDPGLSEASQVVYPQGGKPFVVIQSLWSYVGTATGTLTDDNLVGVTAEELYNRFMTLRAKRGQELVFVWADESISCVIYSTTVKKVPVPNAGVDYQIGFSFVRTD
jgi:hypothetical protein